MAKLTNGRKINLIIPSNTLVNRKKGAAIVHLNVLDWKLFSRTFDLNILKNIL